MALQVWLPLNGNLSNNGVGNYSIVNIGTTIDNNGKLGKCYSFNGSSRLADSNSHNYSYPLTVACWIYPTNLSSGTQYIISVNQDTTGSPGHIIGFGFVSGKLCAFVGGNYTPYSTNLSNNIWYHIAVIIDINKNWSLWINGLKVQNGTCGNPPASKWFTIGARCDSSTGGVGGANYYFQGKINDVRLYDHALSEREVKEISKALVLHYPLNGNGRVNENLLIGTAMTASERAQTGFVVYNSTDWTKYFRFYPSNGAASNHSFSEDSDTITLSSGNNRGIAFQRKATDINLDSNSYYTLSCEAKCEVAGAALSIGLTYYNGSSFVTRGGTNLQNFNEVDTWQKFSLTFKPDSNTQYIMYCFTVNSTSSQHFSIRHCKMEKGEIATPWIPNIQDVVYSELGYNSTTELDISGNNYNGIKMGSLDYNKDTARFRVSTVFNGTDSYIEADSLPTETKTISVWCKTSWEIPSDHKMIMHDKQTGIAIGITKKGYIDTYIGSSSGGLGSYIKLSTTNYTANIWNHIVIVKTGEDTRDVYINSIKAIPSEVNYWAGDLYKLNIGVRHSNGSYTNYFDGQLSDFRAYATALSADDVKELYNQVALSSSLIT